VLEHLGEWIAVAEVQLPGQGSVRPSADDVERAECIGARRMAVLGSLARAHGTGRLGGCRAIETARIDLVALVDAWLHAARVAGRRRIVVAVSESVPALRILVVDDWIDRDETTDLRIVLARAEVDEAGRVDGSPDKAFVHRGWPRAGGAAQCAEQRLVPDRRGLADRGDRDPCRAVVIARQPGHPAGSAHGDRLASVVVIARRLARATGCSP